MLQPFIPQYLALIKALQTLTMTGLIPANNKAVSFLAAVCPHAVCRHLQSNCPFVGPFGQAYPKQLLWG